MSCDQIFSFVRKIPVIDAGFIVVTWLAMLSWWRRARPQAEESRAEVREAGARAVTNQINALLTAASIILAGSGSVLAIGLGKDFPAAALEHLIIAAAAALVSIILGVYTLGYIPSVLQALNVTRKLPVMIACFVQMNLIIVSAARFLGGLWQLLIHLSRSHVVPGS